MIFAALIFYGVENTSQLLQQERYLSFYMFTGCPSAVEEARIISVIESF